MKQQRQYLTLASQRSSSQQSRVQRAKAHHYPLLKERFMQFVQMTQQLLQLLSGSLLTDSFSSFKLILGDQTDVSEFFSIIKPKMLQHIEHQRNSQRRQDESKHLPLRSSSPTAREHLQVLIADNQRLRAQIESERNLHIELARSNETINELKSNKIKLQQELNQGNKEILKLRADQIRLNQEKHRAQSLNQELAGRLRLLTQNHQQLKMLKMANSSKLEKVETAFQQSEIAHGQLLRSFEQVRTENLRLKQTIQDQRIAVAKNQHQSKQKQQLSRIQERESIQRLKNTLQLRERQIQHLTLSIKASHQLIFSHQQQIKRLHSLPALVSQLTAKIRQLQCQRFGSEKARIERGFCTVSTQWQEQESIDIKIQKDFLRNQGLLQRQGRHYPPKAVPLQLQVIDAVCLHRNIVYEQYFTTHCDCRSQPSPLQCHILQQLSLNKQKTELQNEEMQQSQVTETKNLTVEEQVKISVQPCSAGVGRKKQEQRMRIVLQDQISCIIKSQQPQSPYDQLIQFQFDKINSEEKGLLKPLIIKLERSQPHNQQNKLKAQEEAGQQDTQEQFNQPKDDHPKSKLKQLELFNAHSIQKDLFKSPFSQIERGQQQKGPQKQNKPEQQHTPKDLKQKKQRMNNIHNQLIQNMNDKGSLEERDWHESSDPGQMNQATIIQSKGASQSNQHGPHRQSQRGPQTQLEDSQKAECEKRTLQVSQDIHYSVKKRQPNLEQLCSIQTKQKELNQSSRQSSDQPNQKQLQRQPEQPVSMRQTSFTSSKSMKVIQQARAKEEALGESEVTMKKRTNNAEQFQRKNSLALAQSQDKIYSPKGLGQQANKLSTKQQSHQAKTGNSLSEALQKETVEMTSQRQLKEGAQEDQRQKPEIHTKEESMQNKGLQSMNSCKEMAGSHKGQNKGQQVLKHQGVSFKSDLLSQPRRVQQVQSQRKFSQGELIDPRGQQADSKVKAHGHLQGKAIQSVKRQSAKTGMKKQCQGIQSVIDEQTQKALTSEVQLRTRPKPPKNQLQTSKENKHQRQKPLQKGKISTGSINQIKSSRQPFQSRSKPRDALISMRQISSKALVDDTPQQSIRPGSKHSGTGCNQGERTLIQLQQRQASSHQDLRNNESFALNQAQSTQGKDKDRTRKRAQQNESTGKGQQAQRISSRAEIKTQQDLAVNRSKLSQAQGSKSINKNMVIKQREGKSEASKPAESQQPQNVQSNVNYLERAQNMRKTAQGQGHHQNVSSHLKESQQIPIQIKLKKTHSQGVQLNKQTVLQHEQLFKPLLLQTAEKPKIGHKTTLKERRQCRKGNKTVNKTEEASDLLQLSQSFLLQSQRRQNSRLNCKAKKAQFKKEQGHIQRQRQREAEHQVEESDVSLFNREQDRRESKLQALRRRKKEKTDRQLNQTRQLQKQFLGLNDSQLDFLKENQKNVQPNLLPAELQHNNSISVQASETKIRSNKSVLQNIFQVNVYSKPKTLENSSQRDQKKYKSLKNFDNFDSPQRVSKKVLTFKQVQEGDIHSLQKTQSVNLGFKFISKTEDFQEIKNNFGKHKQALNSIARRLSNLSGKVERQTKSHKERTVNFQNIFENKCCVDNSQVLETYTRLKKQINKI